MPKLIAHVLMLAAIGTLLTLHYRNNSESTGAEYPSRPIKLVVPFNPGGGSDTFARIIKAGIDEHKLLPQPLVIINRPGGSATIGSRYVRDAKPDGYTLLMLHDALITAKYSGKVPYGPEAFEPIAGTGEIGLVVAVHESSPFDSLREFLEAAREKPDAITYGVNIGAPSHFLALRMEAAFPGARFRYTHAGDGTDRLHKLAGEHIQAATFSATEYLNFREKGLKGLALFSEKPRESIPDLPTALQQGIDVVEVNMQYWWFPKGTPQDRVDYIGDVLRRAMETETVLRKLDELKMAPRFYQGEEHRRKLAGRIKAAQEVGGHETPEVPNIPLVIGCGLAIFLILMFVRRTDAEASTAVRVSKRSLQRAAGLLAVSVVYVFAMQSGFPFTWATVGFVCVSGLILCTDRRRILLPLLETAFLVAFGVHHVLTEIVVTDLP